MSAFAGRYFRGAMRDRRHVKRLEAGQRDQQTPEAKRRRTRRRHRR